MTQMDHLDAATLQDPAHDIDRGIVAVEQAGGRHKADRVFRCVGFCG